MGRGERKSRLDKGTAPTEFTGFAAFATPGAKSSGNSSFGSNDGAAVKDSPGGRSPSTGKGALVRPCPIYTGSDPNLTLLFKKIGWKRDAVTKSRALAELGTYAFPDGSAAAAAGQDRKEVAGKTEGPARQEQIATLSHLIFLVTTKLNYENASAVRAEAWNCLTAARPHVPKAWRTLMKGSGALGMGYCGLVDPASEVRTAARGLADTIRDVFDTNEIRTGVIGYVTSTLPHGRASALNDALFGGSNGKRSGGEGKAKGKKDDGQQRGKQSEVSESEREEMEERYERTILCVLGGMELLVRENPEEKEETAVAMDGEGVAKKMGLPKVDDSEETRFVFRYRDNVEESGILWKFISSSRGSFRRKTYHLLATLSQHAQSLIHYPPTKLPTLLPTALASEKEGANIPPLLELLLVYIVSFKKHGKRFSTAWDESFGGMDVNVTCKNLCKLLRKGCYGATASSWCPTVLPLLASLPPSDVDGRFLKLQNQVLGSLWDGHKAAIGPADALVILAAVAECSSYLLLRPRGIESDEVGDSDGTGPQRECAQHFLNVLAYFLNEGSPAPSAMDAHRELLSTLVRDLRKLDVASHEGNVSTASSNDNGSFPVRDVGSWLWMVGVPDAISLSPHGVESCRGVMNAGKVKRLGDIVEGLLHTYTENVSHAETDGANAPFARSESQLVPTLRDVFHAILAQYQDAGNRVPDLDSSNVLLVILSYCGVMSVFSSMEEEGDGDGVSFETETNPSSEEVEKFCMNDLLHWIIVRSSLSSSRGTTSQHSSRCVRTYFELLRLCLVTIPMRQKRVWESMLREMIVSKSDLELLSIGVAVVAADESGVTGSGLSLAAEGGIVGCETLDKFAVQVGKDAVEEFNHHAISLEELPSVNGDERHDADSEDGSATHGHDSPAASLFLHTCAALSHDVPHMLVASNVVREWIDTACPLAESGSDITDGPCVKESSRNILLDVLLSLAPSSVLNQDDVVRIVFEAWRQGGEAWYGGSLDLLIGKIVGDDGTSALNAATPTVSDAEASRLSLCGDFISLASSHLQRNVLSYSASTFHDDANSINRHCRGWSQRAWRLLQLCTELQNTPSGEADITRSLPAPSLGLVGLDDIRLWEDSSSHAASAVNHLHLRLMYLLHRTENAADRREILWGGGTAEECSDASALTVHILISLSDADLVESPLFRVRQANLRCVQFLSLLGGKDRLPRLLVESWCRTTVGILSGRMRAASDSLATGTDAEKSRSICAGINRGVSVLSLLVGILFDEFHPPGEGKEASSSTLANSEKDNIDPSKVKEGDILWYAKISSAGPEAGISRVKVKVVKVHTDDLPNLYFTIRMLEGGDGTNRASENERQTVADRLKTQQTPPCPPNGDQEAMPSDAPSEGIMFERQRMEGLILDQLVKPHVLQPPRPENNPSVSEAAAECINIVISRCGLSGKAGLGTARYDVFKIVSSLESYVVDSLKGGSDANVDNDTVALALRVLSCAMGFGRLATPPSPRNFDILKFQPDASIDAILELCEDEDAWREYVGESNSSPFDSSVLAWLSASVSTVKEGDTLRRLMVTLNTIAARISPRGKKSVSERCDGSTQCSLLLMRAIQETQKVAHQCIDYSREGSDSEETLLSALIGFFVHEWQSEVSEIVDPLEGIFEDGSGDERKCPAWQAPFISLVRHNASDGGRALLAAAAKGFSEDLCGTLFVRDKQWCGFQILDLLAMNNEPLFSDEEIVLGAETRRRLDSWKEDLEEEEAVELDEDVLSAARWLPQSLRSEIESWTERSGTGSVINSESRLTGQMLTWLVCLDFLDSAASLDMRNRTSLSSYIDRCGAVGGILDVATQVAKLDNDRDDMEWIRATAVNNTAGPESFLSQSSVATLVVFRTVEALPTLAKAWWTDCCPRSLSASVSQFVRNRVAPETLRRELSRINSSSHLGAMAVSGSCVSREVVATYVQDECQLSVMIRIPPSFPLRNVEVDCQKTLGIAEKRWRRWALQIMRMLNSQDGSVLDALLLWKQNVDKEFEGVEPCPVCYSVLCVKTHAMPNLECKTCQNRFHSSCLYKWFHSSGKSQCVLCQQPWSGTKV